MKHQSNKTKPDAVLTIDYDTVFSLRDVSVLVQLLRDRPDADAIAAIQSRRGKDLPMFTIKDADGQTVTKAATQTFAPDLTRAASAHFGLTILRAEKFAAPSKSWFQDLPAPDNTWGAGRQDADSAFWHKWAAVGNSLYIANRVPVGHLELLIQWPGKNLRSIYQTTDDFYDNGISKDAWR